MNLITHLNIVPRSGMSGAIPSFPQYAFMEWYSVKNTGTTFTLPIARVRGDKE
jgi:hypothetical protein